MAVYDINGIIISGDGESGELSDTVKELILTLFQNAEYSSDQSQNLLSLAYEWGIDTISISDVDESLREKVLSVVEDINSADDSTVNFVVLTDTHGSANGQKSQNAVRYILRYSKAKVLFWLGDMCAVNWSQEEYNTFTVPLLNCADSVYPTLGNHEYFAGTDSGRSKIYTDFLANKTDINGVPTSFYYYMDDDVRKVRYIIINTSDGSSNNVSSAQLSWLQEAVQLPANDWKIIAMSHFPLTANTIDTEHVTDQTYQIRDTLLSTNGTVLCYLSGHLHTDVTRVIDYAFYEVNLKNDSVSGQAISVFNINLSTSIMNLYRIGIGSDQEIDLSDLPVSANYTITNTLSGCTNTNDATSVIGNRPYSAVLNAESNYDLDVGTVVITMGGNDVTSTVYNESTHAISIASVTGNVVITATAVYVEPIEEYSPEWLIRDTSSRYPKMSFTSQSAAHAGFPDTLSIITCNGTSSYPTGFRTGSVARYATRSSGYTARYWDIKSLTSSTNLITAYVDGKRYAYCNLTKSESDAAFAKYENDIANNSGIDYNATAGISLFVSKASQLSADHDYWVLDMELTASNIESIIRSLPAHGTE